MKKEKKGLPEIKRALSAALCVGVLTATAGCAYSEKEAGNVLNVIDDKYRTTYEVFLYSFYDSDGDGIGDIEGLIQKLDYINDGDDSTDADLGCNQIWLMPVSPSPTYHKYDVTDYCMIDPDYGTLDDYKKLIEEAHKRGIRVINDMVMNHTSSQHPWFKEAVEYLKNLPEGQEINTDECPYVGYYNFSKEQQTGYEKLSGLDWYYEARFWSEMPDLNLDNEKVHEEFAEIARFWTGLGCDGFRMDAVTSYYTDDTVKSTEALSKFVEAAKSVNPDAYIVGEAWTGMTTYAKYYESGIDSLFDFDFADAEGLVTRCARGKMSPVKYLEEQIKEDELFSSYNEDYVNAPFYTNHDMARSAGFYTGKQAKKRNKLAGALNLLMSGNAFVYYGEEIGMKGSGKDENKRAPMQWTSDENAAGMCKGPSGMDDIKMTNGDVESQEADPYSILNYYKAAIKMRNMYPAVARGDITILNDLCDDGSAVWIKKCDPDKLKLSKKDEKGGSSFARGCDIMIALNNSDEPVEIDLSKSSEAEGYRTLSYKLLTEDGDVTLEGDVLTLPGCAIAVLTK